MGQSTSTSKPIFEASQPATQSLESLTTQSKDPSRALTEKISQKPTSQSLITQTVKPTSNHLQTRCPICELSLIGGNILCNLENVELCSLNQVCQLNIRQRGDNVIAVESGCKERTACFNEKR